MSVRVDFSNELVARTGTNQVQVSLAGKETTLATLVERMSEQYGPQVRSGLMEGDRLRKDTVAVRETERGQERLTPDSTVHSGDTIHFQRRSKPTPA
jgi:hypothetical protein